MQAVILAAGMGKRLKELTQNNAKCMVKVNEVTLIERMLRILDKKHLSKIVVVIGFKGKQLADFIKQLQIKTEVVFVNNDVYDKTNNIYSLLLAKEYMVNEDTLLLESDIIFEESLIDLLLEDERPTLALVDKFASWMDGTCMELSDEDEIRAFIQGKYLKFAEKENYFKTVNIYKFSAHFSEAVYIPFLEAYFKAMGVNEYYESVIRLIAMLEGSEIRAKRLDGQVWYEIDDVQDLDIASTLFANTVDEKYQMVSSRYGGYWRFPKMLDFCYLVNPYFPPVKMMEEMKSNFEILATQYPSGMQVNSLLASKCFGVKPEHIVIGNGAAELIKCIVEGFEGRFGIVCPTFEEYNHRFHGEVVEFKIDSDDMAYDVEDVITFFESNTISQMVLINPDNPSGNYIEEDGVIKLINWCKEKGITLIVDESFIDFADDNEKLERTYIKEGVLALYDQLFVVKSISKSYGVPGFRLGVLASSNELEIARLKKEVSIWNINSYGEFFMQIFEKYKKDYVKSLDKIRNSRRLFAEELKTVDFITVFPSQANYIMCRLEKGFTAKQVAQKMFEKNILIKTLTSKVNDGHEYIRIAIRTREENHYLVTALKNLFN